MFTRTITFALALSTGALLGAQNQLTYNYGTSAWGGRATLAGHANFTTQTARFGIDYAADLGGYLNARVRINGSDREAFHAQGDLDGRLTGSFLWSTGGPVFLGTSSLDMAGLIRVGGLTVFRRTYNTEVTRTINLAPLNVFVNGDVRVGVRVEFLRVGLFSFTIGVGATADIDTSLTPVLNATPSTRASLTANLRGTVQGRAYVAVGTRGASAGVRATLDLADPVTTVYVSTDFRTAVGQVCWSIGRIVLTIHPYVYLWPFGEAGFDLLSRTYTGTSGCRQF